MKRTVADEGLSDRSCHKPFKGRLSYGTFVAVDCGDAEAPYYTFPREDGKPAKF